MRSLPPLSAVRVFEAAARHENFTAAAAELAMTQAAVSYQVKLLERRLGLPLFLREGRRVSLSEAGRRLSETLSDAFDLMEGAFGALRSGDEALLTISTTMTFANAWFAWRLGSFQMANPQMAVRLHAGDTVADLAREEADVAVRYGRAGWPGMVCELLLDYAVTPMCSPDFLAAQGGALRPADVLRLPQVSPHDPLWSAWLEAAGVESDGAVRPGVRLDSQANEGAAAMAGQGMALLTPFFWRNDMADGRLVRPFPQLTVRSGGYWLVYPEHRRNASKVRRFRDWLLAEVARDQDALAWQIGEAAVRTSRG